MEGVVVSAKHSGATITISVVSDDHGHYSFPASKIGPGRYDLRIRAIGYDLDGPATIVVRNGMPATADLRLRPVDDITDQMSPAEWIASVPGSEDQKRFLYNCATCHGQNLVSATYGTPLAGPYFDGKWRGQSVGALFQYAHDHMPPSRPGALPDATYADITAYVLATNGFAPGAAELPADAATLNTMTITPRSN